MNNTVFTLDIAKSRNTELIKAAKRYRLAKETARGAQNKPDHKGHSGRRTSHSDETPMT
ncbi:MAG: hypothetical protein ACJ786_02320 [Catenulispora sp.]